MAILTLFLAAMTVLVLGTLASCFPSARAAASRGSRRPVAAATAAAGLAVVGGTLALEGVEAFVRNALPKAFSDAPVGIPGSAATALPAVAGLEGALLAALLVLGLVGVALHLWAGLTRVWVKAFLATALLVAVVPVGPGASGPEILAGLVRGVVLIGSGALLVRFVLGSNPAAYLLSAAWVAGISAASPLIGQPGTFYQWQGWLLLGFTAAASAWWLLRSRGEAMQNAKGRM
jgi:hypothetical protein